MYEVDLDYGKLKLISHSYTPEAKEIYFCPQTSGWHLCNDKYKVERPKGGEDFLLFITVSGKGSVYVGDQHYDAVPHSLIILPPNLYHKYFTPPHGQWEFYWIHVTGKPAEAMLYYITRKHHFYMNFPNLYEGTSPINELLTLSNNNFVHFEVTASNIVSSFLHYVIGVTESSGNEPLQKMSISRSIKSYIDIHFHEKITLKMLSDHLYISTTHIIRVFKADTGITPYEYILQVRINKAKELLKFTDISIKEIGGMVGFQYTSNFIAQFKGETGYSPNKYRASIYDKEWVKER